MSLANFMLPETVSEPFNLKDLVQRAPSGGLFSGYDPISELGLRGGSLVPAATRAQAFTAGGYKAHRTTSFLESLPDTLAAPVLWDMEDARAFDAEVYFGRPLNVFQYNRRRGDRHAVLWRLRAYFEPSRNVGHPGVIVDDPLPFRDKRRSVFWRGSMAGSRWVDPHRRVGPLSIRSAEQFESEAPHYSRLSAVLRARTSVALDFKFTGPLLESRPWLDALGVVGEHVTPAEQLEHRYILCPNGNDVASSLYWLMQTNSVAFREDCSYEVVPDYFLKPWIHYVPVSKGLTDVEELFAFCEAHPELCERIIANANAAYEQMTDSDVWREAELEVLGRLGVA